VIQWKEHGNERWPFILGKGNILNNCLQRREQKKNLRKLRIISESGLEPVHSRIQKKRGKDIWVWKKIQNGEICDFSLSNIVSV